jgi:hypothetical protein
MEHNHIIISDEDVMEIRRQNIYCSDFKVEYLGQFMEMSWVVNGGHPINYIRATYTI